MSTTAFAISPSLSPSERELGRTYLEQTHSGVAGAIRHLSPAQWEFQPPPDRWSVAQNVEHVIMVQGLVIQKVREVLPTAAASPEDRDVAAIDAIVLGQFPHRFGRFNAPEPLLPKGGLESPEDALRKLAAATETLIQLLETTGDLRGRVLEAAPLKAVSQGRHTLMDGYQWVLTAAAHTERHTNQILEAMAAANFPSRG